MDMEFLEIGNDYPPRIHIVGEKTSVAPRLSIRGQLRPIGLFIVLPEIDILALLLN